MTVALIKTSNRFPKCLLNGNFVHAFQIALAVAFLIKPWALAADNHRRMSRVLMEEPGRIYLGDLRRALAHVIEEKGPLTEIASTNVVAKEAIPEEGEVGSFTQPYSVDWFGILYIYVRVFVYI